MLLVRLRRLLFTFVAFFSVVAYPAHAVKSFKVSANGGAHQLWFEAEDFDSRDSANVYKIRKAEAGLDLAAGAFGDALTNAVGAALAGTAQETGSWVRYDFDISKAGGKAGTWYFWGRIISPNNQSDWLWIKGEQGNTVPTKRFDAPDNAKHRILEETTTDWTWVGGVAKGEGHVRALLDGANTMVIFWRQSDNSDQWDTFVWTDSDAYKPTDADYASATSATSTTAVDPQGKTATFWGTLKSIR
jgi:hypothetical protein